MSGGAQPGARVLNIYHQQLLGRNLTPTQESIAVVSFTCSSFRLMLLLLLLGGARAAEVAQGRRCCVGGCAGGAETSILSCCAVIVCVILNYHFRVFGCHFVFLYLSCLIAVLLQFSVAPSADTSALLLRALADRGTLDL